MKTIRAAEHELAVLESIRRAAQAVDFGLPRHYWIGILAGAACLTYALVLTTLPGQMGETAMRLDDDAHAVSIAADINERTGRLVRRANVYMTLQRLEEKGLLTTALGEPRAERGGKPRRIVTPTRDGVAAVRATMTAITAMTRGVKI